MKILILGSRGSLGQQLKMVFEADNEVISWDREEVDITDKELVLGKIQDIKPAVIINAAAYNAVDKCENDDKEYDLAMRINGKAVEYLAEGALKTGATLVHYSSDYVFNGEKEEGYKEDDETGPINRYGETKLAGETAVISLSGRGLKWYLIRTSKLFGPKGSSADAKESFFDLILRLSKDKKEFNMIDGEEISCFTYTPDLASATKELLESDLGYGIYHIFNEGAVSWYEAAKYLFEIKNIKDVKLNPVKSEDYPRPARRPGFSTLINTKFRKLRSWQEALREYLK